MVRDLAVSTTIVVVAHIHPRMGTARIVDMRIDAVMRIVDMRIADIPPILHPHRDIMRTVVAVAAIMMIAAMTIVHAMVHRIPPPPPLILHLLPPPLVPIAIVQDRPDATAQDHQDEIHMHHIGDRHQQERTLIRQQDGNIFASVSNPFEPNSFTLPFASLDLSPSPPPPLPSPHPLLLLVADNCSAQRNPAPRPVCI